MCKNFLRDNVQRTESDVMETENVTLILRQLTVRKQSAHRLFLRETTLARKGRCARRRPLPLETRTAVLSTPAPCPDATDRGKPPCKRKATFISKEWHSLTYQKGVRRWGSKGNEFLIPQIHSGHQSRIPFNQKSCSLPPQKPCTHLTIPERCLLALCN